MQLGDYAIGVARTAGDTRLEVLGLGITGEAGEVADLLKKHIGHGHPLDKEKLIEELGDVLWYIAALARALGASLDEVAEGNLQKLRRRYPDGFDKERSINREPRPIDKAFPDWHLRER